METKQMCSNIADFATWLNYQLTLHNMKVSYLSKISGVHANTIRNYLSHRCEPTLYNTILIVRAFGYELEAVKSDNK